MYRCHYCGEISDDHPDTCILCGKRFCRNHQAPKNHNCPNRSALQETPGGISCGSCGREIAGPDYRCLRCGDPLCFDCWLGDKHRCGEDIAGSADCAGKNLTPVPPRAPAKEPSTPFPTLKRFTVFSVFTLVASPFVLVMNPVLGIFCLLLGLACCTVAYFLYAVRCWQTRRYIQAVIIIAFPLFACSMFIGHIPLYRSNVLEFLGLRFFACILTAGILAMAMARIKTTMEQNILKNPSQVPPPHLALTITAVLLMTFFGLIAGASFPSDTSHNLAISKGQDTSLLQGHFTGIIPEAIGGITSPSEPVRVATTIPEKYRYLATGRSVYTYTYYLRDKKGTIAIDMYKGVYTNISENRGFHEQPPDPYKPFAFIPEYDNPVQKAYLRPLVDSIRSASADREEQARIAISLVQNIPYDSGLAYNKSDCGGCMMPYVVLYQDKGICGTKSTLLSYLLKELGFDVAVFTFDSENHAAVGIRTVPPYDYRNTGYAYVETVLPAIPTNSLLVHSAPRVWKINEGGYIFENLSEEYYQIMPQETSSI